MNLIWRFIIIVILNPHHEKKTTNAKNNPALKLMMLVSLQSGEVNEKVKS